MKKRILILLFSFMSCISPITAYAAPTTAIEESQSVEQETNEFPVEDSSSIPQEDGEQEIIQAVNTSYSPTTTCQINFKAILPNNFGLNCYANIENIESGQIYQIPLYSDNAYIQRCYVSAGNYSVIDLAVFDDNTNMYPFAAVDDFTVDAGGTKDIEVTLLHYDEVEQMINDKLSISAEKTTATEITPAVEEKEIVVDSDFDVVHSGTGTGLVGITGAPNSEYNVSLRITKGGVLGTAKCAYTLDEGASYSEELDIPLSGKIVLGQTGLNAQFSVSTIDPIGYVADDTYSAYIPDPSTSIDISHKGTGIADIEVHAADVSKHVYDLLFENKSPIIISIVKSGDYGSAVYQLSTNGGNTFGDEKYVPEDGLIELKDIGVNLQFTSSSKISVFVEGDTYTVLAKKITHTAVYVFLALAFSAVLMSFCYFRYVMLKKKPKDSDYHIYSYTPYSKGKTKKNDK